jgi:hypothetical protein
LFRSIGDHRLLQRGVELLLAAVGTCHECGLAMMSFRGVCCKPL